MMDFLRVQCENHGKPWKIADFARFDGQWREVEAATPARRVEQKQQEVKVDGMPPEGDPDTLDDWLERAVPAGDRPVHSIRLVDGRPGSPILSEGHSEVWETFDLTCKRCKRKRRHASYQRRRDELFELFDELAELGITRPTPEFLQKYETRRDAGRSC